MRSCLGVCGAVVLASCATQEITESVSTSTPDISVTDSGLMAVGGDREGASIALAVSADPQSRGVVFPGNDRGVNMPPRREPVKVYGDAVSLNFEEAPLAEVLHSVLGDILGLDYIVE
ncbi:MAG: hypothetical protein P8N17_06875, partial [Luminiphilus sp.]|nr:hypothetical protein [Luminiphilus sp.]